MRQFLSFKIDHKWPSSLILASFVCAGLWFSAFAADPAKGFMDGVNAYRKGDFTKAEKILSPLHEQAPDKSHITYYLALTKVQMGEYPDAKKLYEEVTLLDPNSEAARLSKIGLGQLTQLPKDVQSMKLDLPPGYSSPSTLPTTATANQLPAASNGQSQVNANQPPTAAQPLPQTQPQTANSNGPNMQDMLMMQMMMGNSGGMNGNSSGNAGLNPMMMYSLMNQGSNGQSAQGNQNGGGINPDIMSTMLMNQMMQNFSLENKNTNE